MTTNDHHNPDLPDDLRPLERSLDALGERQRAAAPDELGARIADAGAAALHGLRLSGADTEPAVRRSRLRHWRMAAALAFLVIAVVAAIALDPSLQTHRGDVLTSADERAFDELVTLTLVSDETPETDTFAALEAALYELERSLNEPWDLDESLELLNGESL